MSRGGRLRFLRHLGDIISIRTVEAVQSIGYYYEYQNDIDAKFLKIEEFRDKGSQQKILMAAFVN